MKFVIQTTAEDFYTKYLASMAGPLGLTYREVEVLAVLMKHAFISESGLGFVSTDTRKRTAKELEITSQNLNNYIGRFREHGLINDVNQFSKSVFITPKSKTTYSIVYEIKVS